jgi:ubiquitin thioesterase protein OTUB1
MNREFFENFIEDGKSVKQFCSTVCYSFRLFRSIKTLFFYQEVEPMARESDNIHIIALTKAATVPLRVIYMDRSQQSSLTIHDFSATDEETNATFEPMITMLYRPGHYDLLYEN